MVKKTLVHFPKLFSAPITPKHTHSLFSVKNHKVLLDCIKAVLKVVILLLVRMSMDVSRFPCIPLGGIPSTLVCLSSRGLHLWLSPKPELHPQAAKRLGVCTSQVTQPATEGFPVRSPAACLRVDADMEGKVCVTRRGEKPYLAWLPPLPHFLLGPLGHLSLMHKIPPQGLL